MIIVQSWRGMDPAGFEWTMTLAAGREHYLFGGHDSLYARCSGLSRRSLWLGQIGPPLVCKSMSMSTLDVTTVPSLPPRLRDGIAAAQRMTIGRGSGAQERHAVRLILRDRLFFSPGAVTAPAGAPA